MTSHISDQLLFSNIPELCSRKGKEILLLAFWKYKSNKQHTHRYVFKSRVKSLNANDDDDAEEGHEIDMLTTREQF